MEMFSTNRTFLCATGDVIGSRYRVMRLLGDGTFGKVVECVDQSELTRVAIKVINRDEPKYKSDARIEIDILTEIGRHPDAPSSCVKLLDDFELKGFVCMVFERLGPSLYDCQRERGYLPFHIETIRRVAQQILSAVGFLHSIGLVHTDIKPENICLVATPRGSAGGGAAADSISLTDTRIKIIDFGTAVWCPHGKLRHVLVCTRQYRAPEVILGLGWASPIDVWSVGAVLCEMFTGRQLFEAVDDLDHLAIIERTLGTFAPNIIFAHASRSSECARGEWHAGTGCRHFDNAGLAKVAALPGPIRSRIEKKVFPLGNQLYYGSFWFKDVVHELLALDPKTRMSCEEALSLPCFAEKRLVSLKREQSPA